MKNDQGAAQSTPPVVQADIDEAIVAEIGKKVADGSGWKPRTDNHARIWLAAQAGARAAFRHRIEHTTPDRNAVLFKRMVYFIECIAHADREGWNDATIDEARRLSALTTTPEPTDPARVSEMADEIARMRRMADDWRRPNLRQVEGPNDLKIYGGTIADDIDRWADVLAATRTPDPVLEVAKEALEPFAKEANEFDGTNYADHEAAYADVSDITVGDLRRARAALQTIGAGQ